MPALATLALFFGVALVLAAMPGLDASRAFQGVIVEATPKMAAFVLALIPHFIDAPWDSVAAQFGVISVALNTGVSVPSSRQPRPGAGGWGARLASCAACGKGLTPFSAASVSLCC